MKTRFAFLLVASLMGTAHAQVPSTAPAGSTGQCKDGTYSDAPSKRGACAGHKGVKDWYASAADKQAAPSAAGAGGAPVPAPRTAAAGGPAAPVASAAAPGGGDGQVWVNSSSKVYHCAGTKYYGKTKAGSYMTEAAALAAGNHADHGKACKAS